MCINCLNAQKVDVRVELTKKTSHCKSRDFLRKRRLKNLLSWTAMHIDFVMCKKQALKKERTKALKKLKIEKKISEFFLNFFSKFPVSRIVPKNVKGGTLFISC